jgi:putative polyhydroxyalkanoate system protein
MSKTISVSIPHDLGRAEARRRIDEGFGQLARQFAGDGKLSFTQTWSGDRLTFAARILGQPIDGRLDVLDRTVRMEVDLPDVLAMIAGVIKGRLQRQGQLLLEKK